MWTLAWLCTRSAALGLAVPKGHSHEVSHQVKIYGKTRKYVQISRASNNRVILIGAENYLKFAFCISFATFCKNKSRASWERSPRLGLFLAFNLERPGFSPSKENGNCFRFKTIRIMPVRKARLGKTVSVCTNEPFLLRPFFLYSFLGVGYA